MENTICVKITSYLTLDNLDNTFMKNLGDISSYELSEDQEDDVRMVVSDILPQSGSFELPFGSGSLFLEVDEVEVEEIN